MNMPMMPEAIEQAAPTRKATPVIRAQLEAEDVRVGDGLVLDDADDQADDHGASECQQRDGRVLTADEGDRTLEDGAGHVLHGLGTLVATQHVTGEVEREEDRDDARDRDDPLQRRRDLHGWLSLLDGGRWATGVVISAGRAGEPAVPPGARLTMRQTHDEPRRSGPGVDVAGVYQMAEADG